jgi:phage gp36-like protein
MAYATPAQFIQKFGLEECAQLLADEQNLLTTLLLSDVIGLATGGVWTGEPTDADQAAANGALARLTRQLVVSSNYMDGYLGSAVTLPVALNDANAGVLEDCCLALARFGLADDSDNSTERMSKAFEQWRVWLKDVQAGRVTLMGTTGLEVTSANRVRSGPAGSGFDWARHGAVR